MGAVDWIPHQQLLGANNDQVALDNCEPGCAANVKTAERFVDGAGVRVDEV